MTNSCKTYFPFLLFIPLSASATLHLCTPANNQYNPTQWETRANANEANSPCACLVAWTFDDQKKALYASIVSPGCWGAFNIKTYVRYDISDFASTAFVTGSYKPLNKWRNDSTYDSTCETSGHYVWLDVDHSNNNLKKPPSYNNCSFIIGNYGKTSGPYKIGVWGDGASTTGIRSLNSAAGAIATTEDGEAALMDLITAIGMVQKEPDHPNKYVMKKPTPKR
jgi:hypothetical protein